MGQGGDTMGGGGGVGGRDPRAYMYLPACLFDYVCMYVCMYVHYSCLMDVCLYAYMCIYVCVCICVHMYVGVQMGR